MGDDQPAKQGDGTVERVSLERIFHEELQHVSRRREWLRGKGRIAGEVPPVDAGRFAQWAAADAGATLYQAQIGFPPGAAREDGFQPEDLAAIDRAALAGLGLSGGGIRAASFSLGVLQACNRLGVLDRIDYLSTVSGGGYIGATLNANFHATAGEFVFDHQRGRLDLGKPLDLSDTRAVRHVRNHSKYLVSGGVRDLIEDVALFVRGWVTNALIVLPYLMLLAALTLAYNPTAASLCRFGPHGWEAAAPKAFSLLHLLAWPAILVGLGVAWNFGWSLRRSSAAGAATSEFGDCWAKVGGTLLVLVLVSLALSGQNVILAKLVSAPGCWLDAAGTHARESFFGDLWRGLLTATGIASAVGYFRNDLVKAARDEAKKASAKLAKYASLAALLLAAALMPVLLWFGYIALIVFGLAEGATFGLAVLKWPVATFGFNPDYSFAVELALAGLVLFLLTDRFAPNSYSLHGLYRDRLRRAFIFDAARPVADTGDLQPFAGRLVVSDLARFPHGRVAGVDDDGVVLPGDFHPGPFPIMNATLNVQASAKVNRRGRNGDFFSFTPLYAGSPATGFVPVAALERSEPTLDLAAVTAISGAAASSNMGAATIRPLAMTLALLNVRLGYWLPNPALLSGQVRRGVRDLFYLWYEMTSKLDETHARVYLTDGGHIENLGAYELLRRRCKLVIVVDAEADPTMSFGALVTLQRYARIDLGVRIEMPWQAIAEHTAAVMAGNAAGKRPEGKPGPQVALGRIWYDNGQQGVLLYVKAALSGVENDYIRAYAARNPSFPHETTIDQFFSEEQLEAYRALGFATAHGALGGKAAVVTSDDTGALRVGTLGALHDESTLVRTLVSVLGHELHNEPMVTPAPDAEPDKP